MECRKRKEKTKEPNGENGNCCNFESEICVCVCERAIFGMLELAYNFYVTRNWVCKRRNKILRIFEFGSSCRKKVFAAE